MRFLSGLMLTSHWWPLIIFFIIGDKIINVNCKVEIRTALFHWSHAGRVANEMRSEFKKLKN